MISVYFYLSNVRDFSAVFMLNENDIYIQIDTLCLIRLELYLDPTLRQQSSTIIFPVCSYLHLQKTKAYFSLIRLYKHMKLKLIIEYHTPQLKRSMLHVP